MKIALIYSYNGSKFYGSQTQPSLNSVEDALNSALSRVGITSRLISSSRTDKGVHALNQLSTTICGEFWNGKFDKLKHYINRHAAPYISIKFIKKVDNGFHPRFDAIARSYRYIISHSKFDPFLSDYVHFSTDLDLQRLNKALSYFVGIHDFKAFYKLGSGEKSSIREIFYAKAYQIDNQNKIKFYKKSKPNSPSFTIINFKANGFLRSQVRLMVSNAIKAAIKDEFLEQFIANFEVNKSITRIPAPPNGLYLKRIFY